jgi:hypothetical protein
MVLRLLTILAAAALALPAAASADPNANFFFSPQIQKAGAPVEFVSSSCDPEGGRITQEWDLDGDGAYDDARGSVATRTYPAQTQLSVGLRVTGDGGAVDVRRAGLTVGSIYQIPVEERLRLISPPPVFRIAGHAFRRRTRLRLLTVSEAPVCSRVEAICTGRGCKRKRVVRFKAPGKRLRIRAWDKRNLRPGAVLEIRVTKGNRIGRVARYRMRRSVKPRRTFLCLPPGDTTPIRCPQD